MHGINALVKYWILIHQRLIRASKNSKLTNASETFKTSNHIRSDSNFHSIEKLIESWALKHEIRKATCFLFSNLNALALPLITNIIFNLFRANKNLKFLISEKFRAFEPNLHYFSREDWTRKSKVSPLFLRKISDMDFHFQSLWQIACYGSLHSTLGVSLWTVEPTDSFRNCFIKRDYQIVKGTNTIGRKELSKHNCSVERSARLASNVSSFSFNQQKTSFLHSFVSLMLPSFVRFKLF